MALIWMSLGAIAFAVRATALACLGASSPATTTLDAVSAAAAEATGEWQERWKACLADVAVKHPDAKLSATDALWPLGPCPKTGLHEFAHLPSGAAPSRDKKGIFVLRPDSALVLVLVPSDRDFVVGTQSTDPKARRFDPLAVDSPSNTPLAAAPIQAFLVSKYELTVGQWRRLREASEEPLDSLAPTDDALLPVTRVAPAELVVGLTAAGLTLPSEAEWEYAARAGTDTPWWTGRDRGSVRRVGEEYYSAAQIAVKAASTWDEAIAILDREYFPRPVGLSKPNAFGLFDIHGNVREVCDGFYRPETTMREGWASDPARATSVVLATRGGCYATVSVDWLRMGRRGGTSAKYPSPTVGVRPILRLGRGEETR